MRWEKEFDWGDESIALNELFPEEEGDILTETGLWERLEGEESVFSSLKLADLLRLEFKLEEEEE